jgi:CubicO group peptidase (beta-lactamase class C family)
MTTSIPEIHGYCDPRFAGIRDGFASNFAAGKEIGAAVCVTVGGRPVVDLWAGHADVARTRPWHRNTIVNVYSTTKALGAICANLLVERGQLDLDAPVARYWPEFAQAGKETLPVRYLLTHQAGLPAVKKPLAPKDLYDYPKMCAELAAQAPWWTPGSAHGYHAMTYGWLVGEVVRRVSGRSIGRFFREEVAHPLALDVFIGCGPELDGRIAEMNPSPPAPAGARDLLAEMMADKESLQGKTFTNPPALAPGVVNSRAWRAAEICSANGHTNARSLARFYSALGAWTRGESFHGTTLMSRAGMERTRTEQAAGLDKVLQLENRIALGFMLPSPMRRFSDNPKAFGHGGAGGSVGFCDPENGVSFGYSMNQMQSGGPGGDPRWWPMIRAMFDAIGVRFTPPVAAGTGTSVGG